MSANLYGRDGKRLFDADRIVDAAGIKIGIFGVSATDDRAPWQAAGIDARDPTAAARDAVASLRARGAAVVIALVHVGAAPESRKLLEAVPGIDWAVLGHSGMNLEIPEAAGGAHMLEAMINGKHLGRLDLHVVGDSLKFVDRGERAMVETMLADHRQQLTEYDKRLGETDPAAMSDYYRERRKQVEQAVARETELLKRLPVAITGSWFENRIIPLDAETPNQTGVAVLVDGYNRESARRAAAGKPAGLGLATERHGAPAARRARPRRRDAELPRLERLRRVPRPRAGVLEDHKTRAGAVRAGARRARPRSVVRRLPRHRLPAGGVDAGDQGAPAHPGRDRVRNLPWARAGPRRGGRQAEVHDPRRPRGRLSRLPHHGHDQRRVRLPQVHGRHRRPGPWGPR